MRISFEESQRLREEQDAQAGCCSRKLVVSFLRWVVVSFVVSLLLVSAVFLYVTGAVLEEYLAIGLIVIVPGAAVFACNPRSRGQGV